MAQTQNSLRATVLFLVGLAASNAGAQDHGEPISREALQRFQVRATSCTTIINGPRNLNGVDIIESTHVYYTEPEVVMVSKLDPESGKRFRKWFASVHDDLRKKMVADLNVGMDAISCSGALDVGQDTSDFSTESDAENLRIRLTGGIVSETVNPAKYHPERPVQARMVTAYPDRGVNIGDAEFERLYQDYLAKFSLSEEDQSLLRKTGSELAKQKLAIDLDQPSTDSEKGQGAAKAKLIARVQENEAQFESGLALAGSYKFERKQTFEAPAGQLIRPGKYRGAVGWDPKKGVMGGSIYGQRVKSLAPSLTLTFDMPVFKAMVDGDSAFILLLTNSDVVSPAGEKGFRLQEYRLPLSEVSWLPSDSKSRENRTEFRNAKSSKVSDEFISVSEDLYSLRHGRKISIKNVENGYGKELTIPFSKLKGFAHVCGSIYDADETDFHVTNSRIDTAMLCDRMVSFSNNGKFAVTYFPESSSSERRREVEIFLVRR